MNGLVHRRHPAVSVGQSRSAQESGRIGHGHRPGGRPGRRHGAVPLPPERGRRRHDARPPRRGRGHRRGVRRRSGERGRRVPRLRLPVPPPLLPAQRGQSPELGDTDRLRRGDAAGGPGGGRPPVGARRVRPAGRRRPPAVRAVRAAGRGPLGRGPAQDHRPDRGQCLRGSGGDAPRPRGGPAEDRRLRRRGAVPGRAAPAGPAVGAPGQPGHRRQLPRRDAYRGSDGRRAPGRNPGAARATTLRGRPGPARYVRQPCRPGSGAGPAEGAGPALGPAGGGRPAAPRPHGGGLARPAYAARHHEGGLLHAAGPAGPVVGCGHP